MASKFSNGGVKATFFLFCQKDGREFLKAVLHKFYLAHS